MSEKKTKIVAPRFWDRTDYFRKSHRFSLKSETSIIILSMSHTISTQLPNFDLDVMVCIKEIIGKR